MWFFIVNKIFFGKDFYVEMLEKLFTKESYPNPFKI
jgi:hypothetical protein|tara:strand:+ start:107 stop:214 length:108 start_codon:yes stop_codon:yes gene_type:complete